MRRVFGIALWSLALLLVGAVLLGHHAFGRGGDHSPGTTTPDSVASENVTPDAAEVVEPDRIVLPFDAYRLRRDEQSLVNRALLILATRCMRARGFADITLPASVVGGAPDSLGNSRRYGVTDEGAARRYGYHLPPNPTSERNSAELDGWLAKQDVPELDAVYGTDDKSGCTENAQKALANGTPVADLGWFTDLDVNSFEQSKEDRRVIPAIRDWRTCMRRAGWAYAGPHDAAGDPRWDADSSVIPSQEIRVATTDVRCKQQARLVETWVAVETEIQQGHIRRSSNKFAQLTETRRLLVLNAGRTVGRPSG
jgi:hypothetical protein